MKGEREYQNGRHKWAERKTRGTAAVASNTLSVNVFTAPGKTMTGERSKPFGERLGFDPMTSTLIFGEYDAVLVDAMTTVAEAEALANWIALHNRNLETIYITHGHFDHFYGLSVLLERFPDARAMATQRTLAAMQMSFHPLGRALSPPACSLGNWPLNSSLRSPMRTRRSLSRVRNCGSSSRASTDSADTTSLYVPSIGLVVAGDVVYNQCHM